MLQTDFAQQIKHCAELLYQNREKEAYEKIGGLLGELNQLLQNLASQVPEDVQPTILTIMNEFITSYQLKDNLALADLFFYVIPEVMQLTSNGAEVS